MAKGDRTILDMQIDMADRAALKRVNAAFGLGLTDPKWWQRTEPFRELVRETLRSSWRELGSSKCSLCSSALMYSARQRGLGLCGPCRRAMGAK
jgi:hypothetical protein